MSKFSQSRPVPVVLTPEPKTPSQPVVPPQAVIKVVQEAIAPLVVLSDRIELTNPTIELTESLFLLHGPVPKQVNKLTPFKATIVHGMIVIEEFHLAIPLAGTRIRF